VNTLQTKSSAWELPAVTNSARRLVFRRQELRERLAKAGVALALAIVQVRGAGARQEAVGRLAQQAGRQQVCRRLADSEVDCAGRRVPVEGDFTGH
jgi:hypothetical protein